jgi:sterol desaturase/sphingolipid hydroxylase (fatty acid hydroxylase superfamily)
VALLLSGTSGAESAAAVAPDGTGPARSVRSIPFRVWVLALSVSLVAGWFAVVGALELLRAHDLSHAVWVAQERMIGPALIAVVIVVFLVERRWPAVRRSALARAHIVDAAYLGLYALVGPFVTVLNTGFAVTVSRHAHFLMLRRLPLVPQVVVVAVILVGIDAMNWAAHAANHRSAALWRFHALHHSQEDMSVLTTFRTHPLSHASYLVALLPALVLEASGTVPAAGLIVYGCLVTLPHANLRWTFGPLGRVFVSPAYHRLHHASSPVQGRRTVNFGFVLVCWDRIAGCAAYSFGPQPVATGVAGRSVPIEQTSAPTRLIHVIIAQLSQPFRVRAGLEGRP